MRCQSPKRRIACFWMRHILTDCRFLVLFFVSFYYSWSFTGVHSGSNTPQLVLYRFLVDLMCGACVAMDVRTNIVQKTGGRIVQLWQRFYRCSFHKRSSCGYQVVA